MPFDGRLGCGRVGILRLRNRRASRTGYCAQDDIEKLRRLRLHLRDHCIEVIQRFFHGQREHFAATAFAGLERGFQIMSGDFLGQRVGDGLAGALLIFDPRGMRQSDPNLAAIDQKFDVDRVSVPRGDGDNRCLIDAVHRLLRPAVGSGEVSKHE